MKIDKITNKQECCIKLNGRLDSTTSNMFKTQFLEITSLHYKFNFDLSGLEDIDSCGIGLLYHCKKIVNQHGGKIEFSKLNKKVYQIFSIVGVLELFEINKSYAYI